VVKLPAAKGRRLPKWARARTRPKPPGVLPDMPKIQDAARAAGLGRLRQAAQKFASGDHGILRSARLSLGRTSLYLSAAPCQRWLPDNRLDWWDAQPWQTGALVRGAPDGTVFAEGSISAFLCEFDPRLATIVGADLTDSALANHPELLPYTRVPWDSFSDDDLAQGIRPDVVSAIGFSTVDDPPKSHPYLARVPLDIDGEAGQLRTVLVNQSDPGALDPNAVRPDLVLRFDTPQRAVGIEFAFVKLNSAEPDPAAAGIVLVATDAAGNRIATSDATDLQTRQHVRNASPHLIGVRDSEGGIVQVALRYLTYEQGEPDGPGAL